MLEESSMSSSAVTVDRALMAVMVYSFARINALLKMKVRDYFVQGRRGWVRLHEKGGKEHEVPRHHNLELYLDEYIAAAGIADTYESAGKHHWRTQHVFQGSDCQT